MSTTIGWPLVAKKISSWVRPGVCEVRASALRPVSALIRLDLPTLERPANAISMPRMAGNTASEPAAAMKRQSPANSLRPRSISSSLKGTLGKGAVRLCMLIQVHHSAVATSHLSSLQAMRSMLLCRLLLLREHALDIVEKLDFGAVPPHDHGLLDHRERVVPGPVDHQPRREARQHEGE